MADFRLDHEGMGAFLRGVELQDHMRSRAERIAAVAEATAPVGPASDPHRGEYKASFEVESGVTVDVEGNRRAYGRVKNTSDHAAAVEYGRGGRSKEPGHSPHHTLTRAIDAAKE